MALPTAITLTGAVIKIATTAVEDGLVEMSLTLERELASVTTFGGKVSAVGSLGGSGTITTVYDETASSPHQTLEDEVFTPTAGGLQVTFQPKGSTATNKQFVFNIVVGKEDFPGTPEDIAQGQFTFETTGDITKSAISS